RKAEELANWEFIKARDSIQDFRDHLARFPGGVTERYVRERLEARAWAGVAEDAGLEELKAFLVGFPDGPHAAEAQQRVAELKADALAAHHLEERQRRETEAWASASAGGDAAALRSFLKEWPKGAHAKAAHSRIKELDGVLTWRDAVVAGIVAF